MHKDPDLQHLYTKVFDDRWEALDTLTKEIREIFLTLFGDEDLEAGWIWANQMVPEYNDGAPEIVPAEDYQKEFAELEDKLFYEFYKILQEAFALAAAEVAADYHKIITSYAKKEF